MKRSSTIKSSRHPKTAAVHKQNIYRQFVASTQREEGEDDSRDVERVLRYYGNDLSAFIRDVQRHASKSTEE
jgi:hypothetical protein